MERKMNREDDLLQQFNKLNLKADGFPVPGRLLKEFPPPELFRQMFRCAWGNHFADPDNLVECDEGHYACGDCYFSRPSNSEGEPVPDCCRKGRVTKNPGHLLRAVLENGLFVCDNYELGCEEKLTGIEEYREHVKNCKIMEVPGSRLPCRYYQCDVTRMTVKDLLDHYVKDHNGNALEMKTGKMWLTIDLEETAKQRQCALLKMKDKHFIFAVEVHSGSIFIWLWALEHDDDNRKLSYEMELRQVGESSEMEDLGKFSGQALANSVDPLKILEGNVESFRLDMKTFEEGFVKRGRKGKASWKVLVKLIDTEKGQDPQLEGGACGGDDGGN